MAEVSAPEIQLAGTMPAITQVLDIRAIRVPRAHFLES
jgi:hypothetical protein